MAANPFTISGMRTSAQTPAQYQAAREENSNYVFQQAQNALQQEQIQQLQARIQQLNRILNTVKQENSELNKNLASKKRELEEYQVFYTKAHEEQREVMRENLLLQVELAKWLELINEQQRKIDSLQQEINTGRARR
jgi:chromosome segregation ATPase